ncbi:hypothetical protein HU200_005117 [Digitaria exilis]|uniref:Uncharacterized protein n=1 Tax=Digitaria exilis TaxID=1010633 RepID=A0A835FTV2_9POAL|nr:hypothetical protein HU200_005117 [Digitaria exilis]
METPTCTTTTILKPVYSTPHPLAGKKVLLTIYDLATFDTFVPTVLVYPAPSPPSNKDLKDGLLKAVAAHPHLAGRLAVDDHGRRFIHLNNEGVLVIETTISADMAVALAGDVAAATDHYLEKIGVPVLQVKLNRYKCGLHHQVADGHSMSTFLTKWAMIVRTDNDDAPPPPFSTGHPPPFPAARRRQYETAAAVVPTKKIKNLKVSFSGKFVTELKADVVGGGPNQPCSTFQCLLTHVWKKITSARGLDPEEFTQVRAGDLLSSSYGDVVTVIGDAVACIDGEYIQSFVDFGAVVDDGGRKGEGDGVAATAATVASTVLCPDMEVDSWLGFKFHETNFGTAPGIVVDGLRVFVPSSDMEKGGVELFVGLMEDHFSSPLFSFPYPFSSIQIKGDRNMGERLTDRREKGATQEGGRREITEEGEGGDARGKEITDGRGGMMLR